MADKKIDFLKTLITYDSIATGLKVNNWQDAIKTCFKKLVENKVINKNYIEAVIKSTNKHGPYYIICPGVAMPHAGETDCVNENGFSLITLDKPVMFLDQEVSVLIGFCAVDTKSHLEIALPQICAVFENKDTVESIRLAKNKEEIIEIISKVDYFKYLK